MKKNSVTFRFLSEPADVNFGGKVHGGAVMKWIDQAGYTCAVGWSGRYCVTVYVGGWSSGGTLTATLSDGSATAYTNSGMSNSSNSYYGHYDLTYNAASANQTLTITWKEARHRQRHPVLRRPPLGPCD